MEDVFTPEKLALVQAAVAADEKDQPMALRKADVPWAINGVTREWFDDCIGAGVGGPPVTAIKVTPFSSGTSVRGIIRVERDGGETLNLFAKTYPSLGHRLANVVTQTAQAEGRFYLEVRPKLHIEAPKGYWWSSDEERFRAIVVINDLVTERQAVFCDVTSTIDRTEAESAMRLLARLHGTFLGDAGLRQTYPWMESYEEWSGTVVALRDKHMQAMEEARDVIPAAIRARGEEIFDDFLAHRQNLPTEGATIIHSDVHLGNWYKAGSGQLGLSDWQCVAVGDYRRDLAYAISTLLDVEDRRAWEQDLIALYVDELSAASGRRIDLQTTLRGFRNWLPAALLMWTPTLVPPDNFPAMQPREMSMKMIERISATIADHAGLDRG